MKSPFPGMDPYLESTWVNVHVLMMGAVTAALNQSLPEGLQARPEEEIRVETLSGERLRGYRADVAVLEPERAGSSARSGGHGVVAEPIEIPYQHAPLTLRNVQIVDTRNNYSVVTVIEVLSPWNKLPGKMNRKYVRKLRDFEAADINWVEVDLLRSSRDRLLVTWYDLPAGRRADYLVLIYRAVMEKLSAYPFSIRDRLPIVPIPLRPSDLDAELDLQAVLHRVYTDGAFRFIDYSKHPEPPLGRDDADWAAEVVRARS